MKRFAAVMTVGLVASTLFTTYIAARPQKILDVEYCIEEKQQEILLDTAQVDTLAKVLWGEARGVNSTTQKAAVCWVVLNRVDHSDFPNSVYGVLTQPNQFNGYSDSNPVETELQIIAADVLTRWYQEHNGETEVGRVIPKEYLYFCGDGQRNYFTQTLSGGIWDWSLELPYAN